MGLTGNDVSQVLDNSLEAHVMRSDNSSLAKDCRKDIKAANTRLLKLGRKVPTPLPLLLTLSLLSIVGPLNRGQHFTCSLLGGSIHAPCVEHPL